MATVQRPLNSYFSSSNNKIHKTKHHPREAIPLCTFAGIVEPPSVWAIISSQPKINFPGICYVNSRIAAAGKSCGSCSRHSVCTFINRIRMNLHWPVCRCWAIPLDHRVFRMRNKRNLSSSYPLRIMCISLGPKVFTHITGEFF